MSQGLWRMLLTVSLGGLPLLLVALMLWSGMAHGLWFYLVALTIFAAGLTASIQLARSKPQDRPARNDSLHRPLARSPKQRSVNDTPPPYSVLLSVTLPSSGVELLRVARALAPPEQLRVSALHLWPEDHFRKQAFEHWRVPATDEVPRPLRPLLEAAGALPVEPLCLVSADVGADIIAVAEEKQADLVLLDWHEPVSRSDGLPGPAQTILQHAPSDVAVYLARQFRPHRRVLVPYSGGPHDLAALELARRLSMHSGLRVTILHVVSPQWDKNAPRLGLDWTVEDFAAERVRLKVVEHADPVEAEVQEAWMGYDLIVVGASETPGQEPSLFAERHERLAFAVPASLLIVRGRRSVSPARPGSPVPHATVLSTVNAREKKNNDPCRAWCSSETVLEA